MKAARKPWMKFYPSDWRADAMLRLCSIGARGLWAEMMCIMHESDRYGSLLVNGKRIDKKQLAGLSGITEKECTSLLIELEGHGVFSRDDDGTIYSRRMRRDYEKAEKDKENGKSGGNPSLKGWVNPQDKGGDKAQRPEARSQKDDDDAGARPPLISAEANKLADECAKIAGHDTAFIPPSWYGAAYRAQTWLNEGWPAEIILLSVREQSAKKRDGPPSKIDYFEKGIASAIAKQNQPLPEIKAAQNAPRQASGNSAVAAIRQIQSDIERQLAENGVDSEPYQPTHLRLSSG
jgi:hypothetical protein